MIYDTNIMNCVILSDGKVKVDCYVNGNVIHLDIPKRFIKICNNIGIFGKAKKLRVLSNKSVSGDGSYLVSSVYSNNGKCVVELEFEQEVEFEQEQEVECVDIVDNDTKRIKTRFGVKLYDRRPLSENKRRKIMERDLWLCVYCNADATCVDHVVPYSWSGCDDDDNLVACCTECNLTAGCMVFEDFKDKQRYILIERNLWKYGSRAKSKLSICTECKKSFAPQSPNATKFICGVCCKKLGL